MKFRKKEAVIVQLEAFGEVITSNEDCVKVKIGELIYDLKPDKVKKITGKQEETK